MSEKSCLIRLTQIDEGPDGPGYRIILPLWIMTAAGFDDSDHTVKLTVSGRKLVIERVEAGEMSEET